MPVDTIKWSDQTLSIIDQTLLPDRAERIELRTPEEVREAIHALRVRGAPAIGVCAAFGVLIGARAAGETASVPELIQAVERIADYIAGARPTAVNLFWALDRMRNAARQAESAPNAEAVLDALEEEAIRLLEHDKRVCRAIGASGAPLINDGDGVLTHCNAGGLATVDYGTALGVFFAAHENGKSFRVYVDETRPLLQGARLTAWELMNAGIDTTLICDNVAAKIMAEDKVQLVVTGADRIAANGDTANKIGTYGLAVLAKAHEIPFYVAAPASTFDFGMPDGRSIPIEERAPEEVTRGFGKRTAPENVVVYNPAFDVTPADLIAGYITECGVLCASRPGDFDLVRAAAAEIDQEQTI